MGCASPLNETLIRKKKEEGRGKREEGRGKKEEGRGKREEGRRNLPLSPITYHLLPNTDAISP
ncbi:MAG: hypothetical protein ACRCT1_21545 [Microcoleaceae cyanobacterium]